MTVNKGARARSVKFAAPAFGGTDEAILCECYLIEGLTALKLKILGVSSIPEADRSPFLSISKTVWIVLDNSANSCCS
jgi:hypothetical protein